MYVLNVACLFKSPLQSPSLYNLYIFQDYVHGDLPPVPPPPLPYNEDGGYHRSPSEDSGLGLGVTEKNNPR